MKPIFQPGSVVQLRCGGPKMVILRWAGDAQSPHPRDGWVCSWHCQAAHKQMVYPTEALRAVPEAPADKVPAPAKSAA
jgi:uncharacterized protein YodC (DUF2158 family)